MQTPSSAELPRRRFCLHAAKTGVAASVLGFPSLSNARARPRTNKIIVLGVDGMDPTLTENFMRAGLLPNCSRLAKQGTFARLGTSDPPQSPVAWSNFIAGTNPGGHGIFDFIARDSATLQPHLSTTKTSAGSRQLALGNYRIPLQTADTELLRQGPVLWDLLEDAGVESTVFRAPVNFPPSKTTSARTLSGITTPDVKGGYGEFTLFTESPFRSQGTVPGGHIERITLRRGQCETYLTGPENPFDARISHASIPVKIEVNRKRTMARVQLPARELLLKEGEWSSWVQVSFHLLPAVASVSGICRFYLKQTSPHLELYVSPVNIDPKDPAMPISSPGSYARELADQVGYFYTQGMPEDTSALSAGVFDDAEFRQQATFVLHERLKFFDHEVNRYENGFFYFYFSSLDLNSHALWRSLDSEHPMHSQAVAKDHGDFLPWIYRQIDQAIGIAIDMAGDDGTVLALSDHGFSSFRRQFNLNSWLLDHGYAAAKNPLDREEAAMFANTRWNGTRAYGLGINSLYVNLRGREPEGVVNPGDDYENLRAELQERLQSIRDPKTGGRVVHRVYRREDIYSGPYVEQAPDLIIGYDKHHRASWGTILGEYPVEHLLDNEDPWSGDHCMDATFLPGVLLSNRKLRLRDPQLTDLPVSILAACGIPAPGEMIGRDAFA